jgi:hypothetical protein
MLSIHLSNTLLPLGALTLTAVLLGTDSGRVTLACTELKHVGADWPAATIVVEERIAGVGRYPSCLVPARGYGADCGEFAAASVAWVCIP